MRLNKQQEGFTYAWRRSRLDLSYRECYEFGTWYAENHARYKSIGGAWRAWRLGA